VLHTWGQALLSGDMKCGSDSFSVHAGDRSAATHCRRSSDSQLQPYLVATSARTGLNGRSCCSFNSLVGQAPRPLAPRVNQTRISCRPTTALKLSVVTTGIALLIFGAVKGPFTGVSQVRSALQTLVVGALAAGAAFGLARAFGRSEPSRRCKSHVAYPAATIFNSGAVGRSQQPGSHAHTLSLHPRRAERGRRGRLILAQVAIPVRAQPALC
jgi:hypothetical protein